MFKLHSSTEALWSQLKPVNGQRGVIADTADCVGHGTHSTSLVLAVSENTDCEVYVARVFRDDPQKRGDVGIDMKTTEDSIARVGHCM